MAMAKNFQPGDSRHPNALQATAEARAIDELDHVLSLRLAGGSYKAIAEATGWSVAKVRKVCKQEDC
jgi:uncharacterized protein YerC